MYILYGCYAVHLRYYVGNRAIGAGAVTGVIARGNVESMPALSMGTSEDPRTYKTYVYWRTRITTGIDGPTGFRAMELTEDCLDVQPDSDTRIFKTPNREGACCSIVCFASYH